MPKPTIAVIVGSNRRESINRKYAHALVKLGDWERPGQPVRASHENWYVEGCPHHGPGLSIADGGRYHMAWFSGSPDAAGIFYAYSDDTGSHFSQPLPAGNPKGNPRHPHVLSSGKDVYLVWLESDGEKNRLKMMRSRDAGATWQAPSTLAESTSEMDSPFLHASRGKVYASLATKADGVRFMLVDE